MSNDNARFFLNSGPILFKNRGDLIISVSDETDRLFFLQSGSALRQVDGKKFKVGKFLDLNSFFGGLYYNYNLVASTDVELRVYNRNSFLDFIGVSDCSRIQEVFKLVAKEQIKLIEYNIRQAS
jgi:CRP-like cAMP-binding protein